MRGKYFIKNLPLHPSKEGTNSFTTLEFLHLEGDFLAYETWSVFITFLSERTLELGSINFNLSILQSPLLGGVAKGRGGQSMQKLNVS